MPLLKFEYQFNYRSLLMESKGRKELTNPLPVIEATLEYNGRSTTDLALIDSGSTFSIFSREIAEQLSINVLMGRVQKLTTLGGPLLGYAHEVVIKLTPNFQYSGFSPDPGKKKSYNLL